MMPTGEISPSSPVRSCVSQGNSELPQDLLNNVGAGSDGTPTTRTIAIALKAHEKMRIEPFAYAFNHLVEETNCKLAVICCLSRVCSEMGVYHNVDDNKFGGVSKKKLEAAIDDQMDNLIHFLTAFQPQVQVEVHICTGLRSDDILVKASKALRPEWIVLDVSFSGHEKKIQAALECNLVLMKRDTAKPLLLELKPKYLDPVPGTIHEIQVQVSERQLLIQGRHDSPQGNVTPSHLFNSLEESRRRTGGQPTGFRETVETGVVMVIVDATRELQLDALKYSLKNLAEPGDELYLVGILDQYVNPLGFKQNLANTSSCICCPDIENLIEEEISRKNVEFLRETFDPELQKLCDLKQTFPRIRFAYGPDRKLVMVERAVELRATWVVLDKHLERDHVYLTEQLNCNIAVMKTKTNFKHEATIITHEHSNDKENSCINVMTKTKNEEAIVIKHELPEHRKESLGNPPGHVQENLSSAANNSSNPPHQFSDLNISSQAESSEEHRSEGKSFVIVEPECNACKRDAVTMSQLTDNSLQKREEAGGNHNAPSMDIVRVTLDNHQNNDFQERIEDIVRRESLVVSERIQEEGHLTRRSLERFLRTDLLSEIVYMVAERTRSELLEEFLSAIGHMVERSHSELRADLLLEIGHVAERSTIESIQTQQSFSIEVGETSVPRYMYLSRKQGTSSVWISLRDAFESAFELHLLCEAHFENGFPHQVETQEGIELRKPKEWLLRVSPWLKRSLQVAGMVCKVVGNINIPGVVDLILDESSQSIPNESQAVDSGATMMLQEDERLNQVQDARGNYGTAAQPINLKETLIAREVIKDLLNEVGHAQFAKKIGLRKVVLRATVQSTQVGSSNYAAPSIVWICDDCFKNYGSRATDITP